MIACIPSSVNDASEKVNRRSTLQEVNKQKKKIDNKCKSSTAKNDEVLTIILDKTTNDDCSSTSAAKVDDVIPIAVYETSDNEYMSITDEHDDVSTSEMMNRQSVIKELNKQKEKIINADKKRKGTSTKKASQPVCVKIDIENDD